MGILYHNHRYQINIFQCLKAYMAETWSDSNCFVLLGQSAGTGVKTNMGQIPAVFMRLYAWVIQRWTQCSIPATD